MKKKILAVILATGMVLSAGLTGCGSDTESSTTSAEDESAEVAAEYCEEVQKGYLGNYDTVEIQDLLEEVYPDGDWNYGTSTDGDYYIVEFTDDDMIQIQFKVDPNDEDTDFVITGFASPNSDYEYTTEEAAASLHSLYWAYGTDNENTGIDVDNIDETDESVLEGHFGPVRSVEESEDASEEADTGTEEVTESEDMESDASQTEETVPEEEAVEDSGTEAEPIEIVYGVYEYDNGSDNVMTAEVGFASDSDEDYIYIDALGYGGHYTANYSGTLYAQIDDGSYPSDNDWGETRIYVTFYEGGMRVQVSSTDDESYYVLDGYYTLTEEFDLDQVG